MICSASAAKDEPDGGAQERRPQMPATGSPSDIAPARQTPIQRWLVHLHDLARNPAPKTRTDDRGLAASGTRSRRDRFGIQSLLQIGLRSETGVARGGICLPRRDLITGSA